jgi:hypothetical protein
MVRTALFEAAHIMLTRATRFSALKRWAMGVAKRRGMKRAKVALARKGAGSICQRASTMSATKLVREFPHRGPASSDTQQ